MFLLTFSRYIKKIAPGLVSNSIIFLPSGLKAFLYDELQMKIQLRRATCGIE